MQQQQQPALGSVCMPSLQHQQAVPSMRQRRSSSSLRPAALPPSAVVAPWDSLAAAALTAAAPLQQDQIAAAITIAVALAWVKMFDALTSSGVLEQVRDCSCWRSSRFFVRTQLQSPLGTSILSPMCLSLMTPLLSTPCAPLQKLSRKLVHATAGPLFLLFWPTFRCGHRVVVLVCWLHVLRASTRNGRVHTQREGEAC